MIQWLLRKHSTTNLPNSHTQKWKTPKNFQARNYKQIMQSKTKRKLKDKNTNDQENGKVVEQIWVSMSSCVLKNILCNL